MLVLREDGEAMTSYTGRPLSSAVLVTHSDFTIFKVERWLEAEGIGTVTVPATEYLPAILALHNETGGYLAAASGEEAAGEDNCALAVVWLIAVQACRAIREQAKQNAE